MATEHGPAARLATGPAVALTGATGFIGTGVLAALAARGVRVRALARKPPEDAGAGAAWVAGDLADPEALTELCAGADVLVHLASRVGGGTEECEAVNDRGTAALMAAATRAGVRRIVHLSTAAVYGEGPHSGIEVDEVPPAPVSEASRTRLLGERHALAAGGHVLRPGLVLGTGDRWVVPALAELVRRVPVRWEGGNARLSVVDRTDLARLITVLALDGHAVPPGVHHASHPEPVRGGDLIAALAALGLLPAPDGPAVPWEECRRLLAAVPGRVSERQFGLIARDHWYRSERIWRLTACPPGPGPLARLPEAAAWYREVLG
ncbi:NAD-dependent epimerase/dehydratase family protein [Streptomyces sp. CBMA156]|uniref:NAD-dependent epimerase/dehydratase family protein n=1 Tax=Streptomyces sp. CBMA156 TaxID=1930280 RepID=UPI00166205A6|nr:NAD-dependent epimerase/dehydratase family protein [Streptomyces sp. CBMA156]MBD0676064.1 autoregulator biosynthesis protein [Streptomyces sp. CBMA156]